MTITGTGSERNPYVVTSNVSDIQTGFTVQYNNVDVIRDIHRLDFRGTAVNIVPGTDEAVVTVTVPDPTSGAVIPAGSVFMFGMATMPTGWLLCDGTTKSISTYPGLFAAIGTNFGGDGITTFGLPMLVDRFPVGASPSKPISGIPGGSSAKTIGVANLPPHAHVMNHDHPAVNSGNAGGHQHDLQKSNNSGSGGNSVAKGTATIADTGPGGILPVADHKHSVDVGLFTGNTGTTVSAAGTPLDVTPPFQALAFGIKT